MHNTYSNSQSVYDPDQDTFLLVDSIKIAYELRIFNPMPFVCVEVGCGSGIVSISTAQILGSSAFYMATDINYNACIRTMLMAKSNNILLDVIHTNLIDPISSRGVVDLLIFNPPYVATTEEESIEGQQRGDITASWAGGKEGTTVIKRLLDTLDSKLSRKGAFILLLSLLNRPQTLLEQFLQAHRFWRVETISKRHVGTELLIVVLLSRLQTPETPIVHSDKVL